MRCGIIIRRRRRGESRRWGNSGGGGDGTIAGQTLESDSTNGEEGCRPARTTCGPANVVFRCHIAPGCLGAVRVACKADAFHRSCSANISRPRWVLLAFKTHSEHLDKTFTLSR